MQGAVDHTVMHVDQFAAAVDGDDVVVVAVVAAAVAADVVAVPAEVILHSFVDVAVMEMTDLIVFHDL
jgi:hypothetical protein